MKLLSIEISRWNRNFTYINVKGNVEKEKGSCQTFTVEMMRAIGVTDLSFINNNSIQNFLKDLLQKGNPITKFAMDISFREKYKKLIEDKIQELKAQSIVSSASSLMGSSDDQLSHTTPISHNLTDDQSPTSNILLSFAKTANINFEARKQQVAERRGLEHFLTFYFESKKPIIFNSHHELDSFVHTLKELDPQFKDCQEYGLLSAFDRGYWLRYSNAVTLMQKIQQKKKHREDVRAKLGFTETTIALTKEEQEEYWKIKKDLEICQPFVENDKFKCAFGDPVQSRSLFIPNTKREDILHIQNDIQVSSVKF